MKEFRQIMQRRVQHGALHSAETKAHLPRIITPASPRAPSCEAGSCMRAQCCRGVDDATAFDHSTLPTPARALCVLHGQRDSPLGQLGSPGNSAAGLLQTTKSATVICAEFTLSSVSVSPSPKSSNVFAPFWVIAASPNVPRIKS
jgi:hypothetical protein